MQPPIYWIPVLSKERSLAIVSRPRSGEWLADEIGFWRRSGITRVVSLLEASEVKDLELSEEAKLCKENEIEFTSFPIKDRGVPESRRSTRKLVGELAESVKSGQISGIHCRASIGRSGLLAGCILVELGVPVGEVFHIVSKARGVEVPDTEEQAKWVASYAKERG